MFASSSTATSPTHTSQSSPFSPQTKPPILTEYAQVLKMLGNGRLEALCFDGEKRLAHIRGKLRKKVWINQGDIILLSLRDYQDEKGDVILKYSADEARSLKAYGELPESAKINETDTYVSLYVSLDWWFFMVEIGGGWRRLYR